MTENKLTVLTFKGDVEIAPRSIIKVAADTVYCYIYTDTEIIHCPLHLKPILQLLKPFRCFYKVHRSFAINMDKIIVMIKNASALSLLMSDAVEVPVAKRNKTEFKEHYLTRKRSLRKKEQERKNNCRLKFTYLLNKNDARLVKCREALHSGKCPFVKII